MSFQLMSFQLAIVWVLIFSALGYLLRTTWKTWQGSEGGCCKAGKKGAVGQETFIPLGELKMRQKT